MSVTTSTSCHISPQSFMVVHTHTSPTFPLPIPSSSTTTILTSKSRSGSMSLATSSGPVRRVIARSFSVSTPSASAAWYPIVPVQAHSSFDVFLDAQGSVHDPYFGEMDLATSSRLMHLEYLDSNASDHEIRSATHSNKNQYKKENPKINYPGNDGDDGQEIVTFTMQSIRTRERARSTRQNRQEPTTPRSKPKESKFILDETARKTEQMRRSERMVDDSIRNPMVPRQPQPQQQQQQKTVKMNFWDAEMAAKKDLEEDDYAWYYRNPQRHVWRPRNARKRMQRRKRVMCGLATGEEGALTNRSLFASYLMQHFPSTLLLSSSLSPSGLGFETEQSPLNRGAQAVGVKSTGTRRRSANGPLVDEVLPGSMTEDWQEDLFSPVRRDHSSCRRRSKRISRSSSLLSSECSHLSDSSANSSQRTNYEDITTCYPGCGCVSQHHTHVHANLRAPINVE